MARVAQHAYLDIRERILNGDYVAGSRLREQELAASVGASRTPIREALRRLDAEGLIEFSPNRGAMVAAWSQQDLEEIFSLRALLEGFGAMLAATRITTDGLTELEDLASQMEALVAERLEGRFERMAELNNAFHAAVIRAAGSRRLSSSVAGVVQVPLLAQTLRRYDEQHLRRSLAQHRELIAALQARDTEWAQSLMRAHVLGARDALRKP